MFVGLKSDQTSELGDVVRLPIVLCQYLFAFDWRNDRILNIPRSCLMSQYSYYSEVFFIPPSYFMTSIKLLIGFC